MKRKLFIMLLLIQCSIVNSQSCEKIMEFVKSKSYGTSYTSYDSDAISKVTFYSVSENYKTLYFAIVCFKKKYSYGCNEYIYQVSSNTKLNYSLNYLNSAGKAFWKYIHPHRKNLNCSPNFN
ncbi:hypothetical protein D6T69_13630 [Tenacibaculum singaporense]|uniref:KTSC domain-containing protein n=1 Tax=Tenacibaculum singaporense TaxID=2358479 RepID=A0A3S8R9Q2_9FLAO|nr:hypothetical protein [Tenacibaculum singaporense]AZJ36507.1 hypothetical protein D6T69_13630 [Tenacibaculum singaporense]